MFALFACLFLFFSSFKIGGADGALRVLNDCRGTDTFARESVDNHERAGMFGRANDTTKGSTASSSGSIMDRELSLKAMECWKKSRKVLDMPMASEENKLQARAPEISESYVASNMPLSDSYGHSGRSIRDNHLGGLATELSNQQGVHTNRPPSVEKTELLRTKTSVEFFKESNVSMVRRDSVAEEAENCSGHFQIVNDSDYTNRSYRSGSPLLEVDKSSDQHLSLPLRELTTPSVAKNSANFNHAINSSKDVNMVFTHDVLNNRIQTCTDFEISNHPVDTAEASDGMDNQRVSAVQKVDIHGQSISEGLKILTNDDMLKYSNAASVEYDEDEEEGYDSLSNDMPTSPPKYTTFDKWVMDYQKRKFAEEQTWALKQKKAEEKITACFAKLKV